MFGKKKRETSLFNTVDDRRTVVNDFRLRSGGVFESYRTVDYRLYYRLEENHMYSQLEGHFERLFAGDIDDGNGDVLDSIIFGAAREALPDLERQHYDHGDMLRRFIVRHESDHRDFSQLLRARECELIELEKEYHETINMINAVNGKQRKGNV